MVPTKEIALSLHKYTDLAVSKQTPLDWYCLLRKVDGSFYHGLNAGYLENWVNNKGEILNYLEYTYLVDLDKNEFIYYEAGKESKRVNIDEKSLKVLAGEFKITLSSSYNPEKAFYEQDEMNQKMFSVYGGSLNSGMNPTKEEILKFFK